MYTEDLKPLTWEYLGYTSQQFIEWFNERGWEFYKLYWKGMEVEKIVYSECGLGNNRPSIGIELNPASGVAMDVYELKASDLILLSKMPVSVHKLKEDLTFYYNLKE